MTSSPCDNSRLTTSIRRSVQQVAGELLAHVLAGELYGGHVRLAHLLDLVRATSDHPTPGSPP